MAHRTNCASFLALFLLALLYGCNSLSGSGGSGTSAAPAGAGSGPVTAVQPSKARPADDLVAKATTDHKWDDFEQMILVLGLKGEAETAFRANMKDRVAKLDQLKASDLYKQSDEAKKQLNAAKEAKDEKKIAELTPKAKDLGKQVQSKMEDLRRIVMGALSTAQQQYWAQYVFYRGLWTSYKALDLTDAQKDKLWDLSAAPAVKLVAGNYVAKDPYLGGEDMAAARQKLAEEASKSVLTDAQRKQLPAPAAGVRR